MTRPSGRAAVAVAAGIGASRVSGFVRELLLSATLGISPAADALRTAARLPNLLQNLLGEGVLSASFIPVYARQLDEDPEAARRTARGVLGLLMIAAGIGAALVVVGARPLTSVLAPGMSGERYELTVDLTRVVAVGTAFLVPSAWCLGVLNSHRRFFVSYVAPVAWNAVQVVVLAVVALRGLDVADAADAAAWALAGGGVAQLAVQLPWVRRVAGDLWPRIDLKDPGVRSTLARFAPAVLGRGATQLVGYIDLLLASLLATGAIASLVTAQVLYMLPIALFAASVAAAELPELARASAHDPVELAARTERGLRRILVPVTLIAACYLVAGRVVVAGLLERGQFEREDTILTAAVLAALAVAMIPSAASRLLQNTLYAVGDVAGPARISVMRVVVAALAGAILMFPFDRLVIVGTEIVGLLFVAAPWAPLPVSLREDPTLPLRLGAVGLAIGSALAAWFELALLRQRVTRRLEMTSLLGGAVPALVAATGASAVVAGALTALSTGAVAEVRLVVVLGATAVVHLALLHVLGVREWTDAARRCTTSLLTRARSPRP